MAKKFKPSKPVAVTIRRLRFRDIATLHRLFDAALETDFQYFPVPYIAQIKRQNNRLRLFLALLHPRRQILVAIRRHRLVGFAFASAQANRIGHLYWLYVAPELRGQKVGDRLLQATLDGLEAQRMQAVELVTYNFDGYYRRHDFWDRGSVQQQGIELHIMQYDFTTAEAPAPVKTPKRTKTRRHWRTRLARAPFWLALLAVVVGAAAARTYYPATQPFQVIPLPSITATGPGSIAKIVSQQHFAPIQVTALARQNYGPDFAPSNHGVTYELVQYRTTDQHGQLITAYAGVYVPDGLTGTPVLAMAPGTTGLASDCAVSLEQPQLHNWANYRSHMMAYAARGFTSVIVDYTNMRGTPGPQPYLATEAEGRAVLDSIRALSHLSASRHAANLDHVFVAGYSQGGHAAFAADNLAPNYAPDVHLVGVIGWGPVLNVTTTWAGITGGSTLSWFGPDLIVSYQNYYGHYYPINNILLPQWATNLTHDVMSHCIDSDLSFWGADPAKVYTPQFLADLKAGTLPATSYGDLQADLEANQIIDHSTTPKLINQGAIDNVVLAAQQPAAVNQFCHGATPVDLDVYPKGTHYNLMVSSFTKVLGWVQDDLRHRPLPTTCP